MKKVIFIIGFLLLFGNGYSQWVQTNGPTGGHVHCITKDGLNVFAGMSCGGIYYSSNYGNNWISIKINSTTEDIYALKVIGNNIFAATGSKGIFYSSDNGINWALANNGLSNPYVRSFTDLENKIFAGSDSGVFLTTNNGNNWFPVNNGLTNLFIYALETFGNDIFAATDSGVYKSSNYGTFWIKTNNGLTNIHAKSFTKSGNYLFVGTYDGVFFSTDSGVSWSQTNIYSLNFNSIISLSSSGSYLFALAENNGGVYTSTNYGVDWTYKGYGLPNQYTKQITALNNNIFVGSSFYGIYHSSNNGNNWSPSNNSIINHDINSIICSGNKIYAKAYDGGIYLSTNNGDNWQSIPMSIYIYDIAVSGSNLYVGTTSGGILHTTNDGQNWDSIGNGVLTGVTSILLSGSNIYVSSSGVVYLSTNNGLNWSLRNNGFPMYSTVQKLAISGTTLYAITYEYWERESGIYKSTNEGNNWNSIGSFYNVISLYVSGPNVYLGHLYGGGCMSSNSGVNWIFFPQMSNFQFSSFALTGTNLFIGTNEGIFLSTNNGTNWILKNQGFNFRPVIHSLLISNNFIFTGTFGNSVWRRPLSEIIGIQPIGSNIPDKFSLSQNYPNPFNPATKIKYQIPRHSGSSTNNSFVTLKIYDILGKEIATLVNEKLSAGEYETTFDGSGLTSGIYFYRLVSGDFSQTRKMILLK